MLATLLPWEPEDGSQCGHDYHPFERWLQIWGEELKDYVCHSQSPRAPMLSWCLSVSWQNWGRDRSWVSSLVCVEKWGATQEDRS